MARYEYKTLVIHSDDIDTQDSTLNAYGKEGWELVSVIQHTNVYKHCYMIREITESKRPKVKKD